MIGKKTLLTFQQYSEAVNARGVLVKTWTDKKEIRGVFCSLSPRERSLLSREVMNRTYMFYVNYQKDITITEKDRFRYGTRYFEITGIKNPDFQNIMQGFYLQEIV